MKLTISNIAWTDAEDEAVLALLPSLGVNAVELAPTRIWSEWEFAPPEISAYREYLQTQGLVCSSLQAIVYKKPDLKVFGSAAERAGLIAHLKRVADLAVALGAKPLVFGAPKNRDRGNLDDKTAFAQAADLFAEVGDYCQQQGVCLCIEPNPTDYACNFITDSQSGAQLVRSVNSPGFRLHLDAAGMHLAGENIPQALESTIDVLEHIHISEPNLGTFSAPQVAHKQVAATLRSLDWNKWISIEMRASDDAIANITQAIAMVKEIYEVA
ncbi:sugar phosphate isomerase/epimerase [Phormidium sp. CLA17]|uniref:sugar phosphate isomerase/epimerase family protein n=1 Tax=Leptolyngbya sp. Cla-17 TaxID=2803751 RepID=UPI0014917D9C|nr:sugar phosphate isomerase/epimerase family protein [Leptolyngbya sp. Cla-17]MBM0741015.1 sugar phosphate isomerase/epimerase [Leptolyngbya sp. Cla-17]